MLHAYEPCFYSKTSQYEKGEEVGKQGSFGEGEKIKGDKACVRTHSTTSVAAQCYKDASKASHTIMSHEADVACGCLPKYQRIFGFPPPTLLDRSS